MAPRRLVMAAAVDEQVEVHVPFHRARPCDSAFRSRWEEEADWKPMPGSRVGQGAAHFIRNSSLRGVRFAKFLARHKKADRPRLSGVVGPMPRDADPARCNAADRDTRRTRVIKSLQAVVVDAARGGGREQVA